MAAIAKEIHLVNLEDEMRQSYLDYAMSVIVGRALPDVRDGLKPVHRRILYAMYESNNMWNRPYVKCARIVGNVLGKYHPHGDTATYEALVRMAQEFSMRYRLVDGQGNFGSIDGDPPAAYRYTECRMTQLSSEILADIERDTVDFAPNYDSKESEPTILPTKIPNLLVNGSSGIAVGMATNIPPHNLSEVVNASLALIENPDADYQQLMQHLPGPDFPTAAIINGSEGIVEAYRDGRGRVHMRARTHVEQDKKSGRERIVVTELPYQVNKAGLIVKIADLVKEKRLEGIAADGLRDESDKDGMRIVIELRRGEASEVILNNLYKHTPMQSTFGVNMVALVDGQPQLLNLKQILQKFVQHRRDVVTRRTIFELRKARERAHVLEGQAVALTNIDEIIALIKKSPSSAEAKEKLIAKSWQPGVVREMLKRASAEASRPESLDAEYGMHGGKYRLSPIQAQAILDLRLHRLTGLEQDKIVNNYSELLDRIIDLLDILQVPERLIQVVREELETVRDQYGDARRTEITAACMDFTMEDLIQEEDVVVTLSRAGYVKWQSLDNYRAQHRGGKGKTATSVKMKDFVEQLFVANTHDTILCFSSRGKVYWIKVYELPQASRIARGKPIVNLLPLQEGEFINAVLPVKEYREDVCIVMVASSGTVKKTRLTEFSRPRSSGILAVGLREDDYLVGVTVTRGDTDILMISDAGKAIRFNENDVRTVGRSATGVRGIKLVQEEQKVVGLIAITTDMSATDVLVATENGYGKRTKIEGYPVQKRGGQGVITIQTSKRNGKVIGAVAVSKEDEIMLITANGTLVRIPVKEVSRMSRNTQGVRLIHLAAEEWLVEVERIESLADPKST